MKLKKALVLSLIVNLLAHTGSGRDQRAMLTPSTSSQVPCSTSKMRRRWRFNARRGDG